MAKTWGKSDGWPNILSTPIGIEWRAVDDRECRVSRNSWSQAVTSSGDGHKHNWIHFSWQTNWEWATKYWLNLDLTQLKMWQLIGQSKSNFEIQPSYSATTLRVRSGPLWADVTLISQGIPNLLRTFLTSSPYFKSAFEPIRTTTFPLPMSFDIS